MDTLAFISRYEAILKEKKIAKGVFYKNCGITDSAVSQWRKGRTNPSMTNINRIADYLSVSAEYLLTGTEQEKKPAPEGELDAETIELRDIWDTSDPDERKALLEMARLLKKRRKK